MIIPLTILTAWRLQQLMPKKGKKGRNGGGGRGFGGPGRGRGGAN